jgi:PAS domain S-box-containing protein
LPRYQAIHTEQTSTVEYRFYHKDGRLRWITETCTSRWDKGDRCWIVTVVSQDVSDRHWAETALHQSEEQRRLALDLSNTSFWDWDVQTGQLSWNENHLRLLGLSDQDTNSDTLDQWTQCIYPEDRDRVLAAFQEAIAQHSMIEIEYRVVHPDGSICWMLDRGQAICVSGGLFR